MRIAIIGGGKAGRALGRLARAAGYEIGPVVCRTAAHAAEAAAFIGGGRPGTSPEGAELTLVTVPDREIQSVARALGKLPPGAVAAHACGAYGAEALRPLRPAGSLHPLRSFGDPARAAELFPGTACAIEGDPEAVAVLETFVRRIGGRPLEVRPEGKALYHAGAVFASNYVLAALAAGTEALERAGVAREEALRALTALAEGTLADVAAAGLPAALTGPVERGDAQTVRRHRDALAREAPGLAAAYAALGRLTIDLAIAKGSIDGPAAERLRAVLMTEESR